MFDQQSLQELNALAREFNLADEANEGFCNYSVSREQIDSFFAHCGIFHAISMATKMTYFYLFIILLL